MSIVDVQAKQQGSMVKLWSLNINEGIKRLGFGEVWNLKLEL